jgi:hypothetical protein
MELYYAIINEEGRMQNEEAGTDAAARASLGDGSWGESRLVVPGRPWDRGDWESCLPVSKRGHARAVQTGNGRRVLLRRAYADSAVRAPGVVGASNSRGWERKIVVSTWWTRSFPLARAAAALRPDKPGRIPFAASQAAQVRAYPRCFFNINFNHG